MGKNEIIKTNLIGALGKLTYSDAFGYTPILEYAPVPMLSSKYSISTLFWSMNGERYLRFYSPTPSAANALQVRYGVLKSGSVCLVSECTAEDIEPVNVNRFEIMFKIKKYPTPKAFVNDEKREFGAPLTLVCNKNGNVKGYEFWVLEERPSLPRIEDLAIGKEYYLWKVGRCRITNILRNVIELEDTSGKKYALNGVDDLIDVPWNL